VRIAVIGSGFWARYQVAGWQVLRGVQIAALYNRTRPKAEALAREFRIPAVYDDAEEMIRREKPDAVDIITDVDSHPRFVRLAADYKVPVICQEPMAPSLAEAEAMVAACREAGVPFYVHENWRWQFPIRQLKRVLDEGTIGVPFRARLDMVSGFPVFINQPHFTTLEQFILADMGSHLLDVARYLFGEAKSVYCQTRRVHHDIRGEDVATVMMDMGRDAKERVSVVVQLGYAENYLEKDYFPQTFAFVEGSEGSIELAPDYYLRVTTENGTQSRRYAPPRYSWADPAYDVVQASIVPCNQDLLAGLRGEKTPETTGDDNLKTVRLVFAAYESAASNRVVPVDGPAGGSTSGAAATPIGAGV
jgi:predicted dehydrogenase